MSKKAKNIAVELPEVMDIGAAETLRSTLLEGMAQALAGGGALNLNAQRAERVSTACLQLLLATIRSCALQNIPCAIQSPSLALAGACHDLGLGGIIGGDGASSPHPR